MKDDSHPPRSVDLDRRTFLRGGALAAGAALTGPAQLFAMRATASPSCCGTRGTSPYGPIFPTRDRITGLPLIQLPRGFRYTTLSWRGDRLDDGNIVARGHDGMAVVRAANPGRIARGNSTVYTLIRNQEVFNLGTPLAPDFNYDPRGPGGTTTLHVQNGRLIQSHVSISGTSSNCAGGPTPWGTWLTCEETTVTGEQRHGYVFECTPDRVARPVPLTAMGRFRHEAAAFDPQRGDVFLTEDNSSSVSGDPSPRRRGNSGFYRFRPFAPLGGVGSLAEGGTLFMLQAIDPRTGSPVDDLRDPECLGEFDTRWIPIDSPDSGPAEQTRYPELLGESRTRWVAVDRPASAPAEAASGPYQQGRSRGATRFQRLEGCWWDPCTASILFVDTEGGPIGAQPNRSDRAEGAVWSYNPRTGRLKNLFVSRGALAPEAYGADNPDNITVSPRGGVLLCEDGGRNDGDGLSLLGLKRNGQTFEFARNNVQITSADADTLVAAGHDPEVVGTGDFRGQEWTGATFSPDGRWLFVNIQTPGITFAITGPWRRGTF